MRQSPLILHDAFTFPGGGEKVAQCLAHLTGGVMWTARFDPKAFPEGYFADRPPLTMRALERYADLAKYSETASFWKCFAEFPRSNPPYAIFSGSLAPLAYKRITGKKILYCHTPPRIIFDQRDFYLKSQSPSRRPAYMAFLWAYEKAYARAARAMDVIVANSQNVAHRLGGFMQLDSVIVHPPVSTGDFPWIAQEDFYLSTARVDRLKRVEVIVEAFLGIPEKRLVVVSGGSELERVTKMAEGAPNIEVRGWVSPEELRDLMGRCLATVYIPRDEDFGISPVESMAAGKPVIGVAEGGLKETVVEGETGILLRANLGPRDVAEAVQAMTAQKALSMREDCVARAAKFDESAFRDKMRRVIEGLD